MAKAMTKDSVKAVIDIGSNSIKLRVVRKEGARLRTLADMTEVVRLGGGLEGGLLAEDAMRRGVEVVQKWTRLAGEKGASPRLVGTMALRAARNADDFVRRVRERTGLTVEILSGEEEARLAWLGAVHGAGRAKGDTAVFDTGGGSTEFIFGAGPRIAKSRSFPVGAVQLTERFFGADPVKPGSVERAREYVREVLASEDFFAGPDPVSSIIGLGGGVSAIVSVKLKLAAFNPERIDGTFVTRDDVAAQVKLYAALPLSERVKIAGLPFKRADIVLASACIVQCALEVLRGEKFRASIRGLRHGLLLEMFHGGQAGDAGV